ncbi:MAG: NAD(+) synthase [Clostridiales bacterium]|nr:NAD(+) synthase [Clostridiales bacterium]
MDYGYIKVAALTPKIKVADCEYNADRIIELIDEAEDNKAKIAVFPELCITGYTCSDLFLQRVMLDAAIEATMKIANHTRCKDMVVMVGLPFAWQGKLYNVAVVINNGEILGIIPKANIPNYSEFYEARHFTKGESGVVLANFGGVSVPFGTNILFKCVDVEGLSIAVEICEDLWVPMPPSISHAMAGATLICNLSASDETTGKDVYRRDLIKGQSARLVCGYIYASAGEGESSTDLVFSGHNIIAENGSVLGESLRFNNQSVYSEVDLDRIDSERRRMSTFIGPSIAVLDEYVQVEFEINNNDTLLTRQIDKAPFVPSNEVLRFARCEEIFNIQALGLKKRLEHTSAKSAVIGISGGLDSTLALLVIKRAFDMLDIAPENIIAVTMPGFGTTDRTYQNAIKLIECIGATLKEISIAEAVLRHFDDIGHDKNVHDVTYENSQARQRTLLLMDIANKYNGLVIGTGDMSELALGWATYNGDHMSMYGVNVSVPKTLVRHLVKFYADTCGVEKLKNTLLDILDTPVSPELLPPKNGKISQKTEDFVGPYELHDFFLYYILRFGYRPKKVYFLAQNAFAGIYDDATILKWLKVFYRRFFSQQFKRSCLPDGPKVGSVAVSPRGDLRMPSDACSTLWQKELDEIG